MKKLGKILLALTLLVVLPATINAKGKDPIKVHIFRGEGCSHCAEALQFFTELKDTEYGKYFELEEHEVWYDQSNSELMQKVADYFGETANGVPYIIIGDKTFQGYASAYDDEIKSEIKNYYNNGDFVDRIEQVQSGKTTKKDDKKDDKKTTIIIAVVAVVGMVALLFFARDPKVEVEKEVKAEAKEETPVKTVVKKTVATKKTASATKKTPAKKTTAKKTTAKKTTKK